MSANSEPSTRSGPVQSTMSPLPSPSTSQMSPTTALPAAPSLSPTVSSHSRNSPSMPSSSSSHPQHSPSLNTVENNERQIAEARAFLAASMQNIGSSLDKTLQERAKNLHDNSKVLEKQQKEVVKATEGLRKENDKLGKMAQEGSRKVKELGNVQNWAEMLERDFLVLGEWVRLVDGESESGSESVSSWTDSEGEEDHVDGHRDGNDTNGLHAEESATDEAESLHAKEGDTGKGKAREPPQAEGRDTDADGDSQMHETLHETPHGEEDKAADTDPLMEGIKMNGTPVDPAHEIEVDHRMAIKVADATSEVMHDDEILAEVSPKMNMDEVILHE